jgi:hypothetical protein
MIASNWIVLLTLTLLVCTNLNQIDPQLAPSPGLVTSFAWLVQTPNLKI